MHTYNKIVYGLECIHTHSLVNCAFILFIPTMSLGKPTSSSLMNDQILYDSIDKEVIGMTYCSICKSCFAYKKLVNGQERSKMALRF